jgi:hypothetical protein
MGGVERAAEQTNTPASDAGQRIERGYHGHDVTGQLQSGPRLAGAANLVLEGGELLQSDRSAGMELAGGDANLCAEAELSTVGKLGRGVVHDNGAVDLVEKTRCGFGIIW